VTSTTRVEALRRIAPLGTLLLLCSVLSFASPHFLTTQNLLQIGLQISIVAILAVGQALVIIAGGIDISVGSTVAFSGIAAVLALREGAPWPAAALGGVLAGGLVGAVNGGLATAARLPPFIATLGTMGLVRGLTLIVSGGVNLIFPFPPGFAALGGERALGLPIPLLILVAVAGLFQAVLSLTSYGRRLYALGGNAEAARLSGIAVHRTLASAYVLCGLLSGLAGVILAARLGIGQPTAAEGYELDVIAACVIGGASLSGGRGSVAEALLGALLIGVLRNGCNLLDISAFWQRAVMGLIILLAVFYDRNVRR